MLLNINDLFLFSLVTKAWGYFMWVNQFLYVSSDGTESTSRVKYPYQSGAWLKLKSVVDGTKVKIYINDNFIKDIVMTGEGAESSTDNYVGLWCHRLVYVAGKDFKVTACKYNDLF